MIRLTRLNGHVFMLNAELIQEMDANPDTVLTLVNGQKIMVREPVDEIRQAVIAYKHEVFKKVLG